VKVRVYLSAHFVPLIKDFLLPDILKTIVKLLVGFQWEIAQFFSFWLCYPAERNKKHHISSGGVFVVNSGFHCLDPRMRKKNLQNKHMCGESAYDSNYQRLNGAPEFISAFECDSDGGRFKALFPPEVVLHYIPVMPV
jgi:hypothetical protein